ncbi:MAG: hypothetical protein EA427_01845 [Spirochaetaceae bacterium]|nr:MAG: hypothetical protein EA427_01845 [Spirochaetaceae bacterium]
MLNASNIAQQPVFYLFIALTILLTLGYNWGKRRNRKILTAAFDAITEVLRPKDQTFTNIGGLTGYHANFIPDRNRYIKQVDATLTMLPRQSWLWLPFSRMIRRFDRLFLSFHLSRRAAGTLREGHLIEKFYSTFMGSKIENADSLQKETFQWGSKTFFLYYKNEKVKAEMERFREMLGPVPGPLRHVALVPKRDRLFVFLIPVRGQVKPVMSTVHTWFLDIAEKAARTRDGDPAGDASAEGE